MHHPHQEPQKSRTTYFPRREESARSFPSRSLSVKSGAIIPSARSFCASFLAFSVSMRFWTAATKSEKAPFFTSVESSVISSSALFTCTSSAALTLFVGFALIYSIFFFSISSSRVLKAGPMIFTNESLFSPASTFVLNSSKRAFCFFSCSEMVFLKAS